MKETTGVAIVLLFVAGVIGWILNFVHVLGYLKDNAGDSSFEIVARVVGVFAFFIGAILGYIP